jgi:transcriptional regulator with XRE-family HTH domain
MGRPEQEIAGGDRALGQLALWLREQRRLSRLTYKELARRSNYSTATLHRASNGRDMPTLDVVLAYADACGAEDRTRARALWRKAQYWHHVPARDQTRKLRPAKIHPQYVENFAQLQRAMLDMRRAAGWPTLRAMEATARAHGHRLPRSALALVLASRAALHKHLFLAYLHACAVRTADHPAWETAWDRANDKPTTTPKPRTGTDPAAPPTPAERRQEALNALQSSGLTSRDLVHILHRLQHLE